MCMPRSVLATRLDGHRGQTLVVLPERGLGSAQGMPPTAEPLVGRERRAGGAGRVAGRGPARVRGGRGRRRAGDRQDAAARRARGPRRRARAAWSWPAARPSSRPTCRSGSSSTRSTSTCTGSSRAASPGSTTTTRAELAHVFPALAGARRDAQERYRLHRAVRALLEELASAEAARADPRRPALGRLRLARAARLAAAAPAGGAGAARARGPPAPGAGAARGRARADRRGSSSARLSAAEARELVGDAADEVFADSGGNPFYLAAARPRAAPRPRPGRRCALAGVEVPRAVAAALAGELAQLSGDARVVLAGAAVAGDPFEPELAAAAAGVERRASRSTRSTSCCAATSSARPTSRAASASATRSCAARSTRARPAAGGCWRTSAARAALAERGASALERAHHVERSARHGDPAAVARAARGRRGRGGPRAGHGRAAVRRPRCGCSDRARRSARTCSAAQAGAHMGAGQWREAYDAIRESLALERRAAGPGDRDRGRAREHARPPPGGARAPAGGARRAPGRALGRGGRR